MTRTLFELRGSDPRVRFSPYCWRVRMALKHKGLAFETRALRFVDNDALAFSGQGDGLARRVPVLREESGRAIVDSYAIIQHLDRRYPQAPLFDGPGAESSGRFIKAWSETQLAPALSRIMMADLFDALDPIDQPYFRASREARLGMTLERFCDPARGRIMLEMALAPLRLRLRETAFLGGDQPGGSDYLAFGFFMWARVMMRDELLDPEDRVAEWQDRLLGAFGGYAASAARAYAAPRPPADVVALVPRSIS
ncbi:glutathione S-transferase N-terminal domain-containing protein [Halotalea alkalilenta]|uniref:glutathione S-transferase N-terminal domain-containing protein n=1 Tax=Halotalea alkalilenta TaxID=376489 RepID=UPI0009E0075C|nr:glutathione S-transferase N-terminal domain-containing protein [Halotalea alkalilenta]